MKKQTVIFSRLSEASLLILLGFAQPTVAALMEPTTQPVTMPAMVPSSESVDGPTTSAVAGVGSDLTDLSLEDLMNVQVTSVSKTKEPLSQTPGAVTVITQEDNAMALADASPQNQFQIHSYWTVIKNVDFNQSLYYVQGTGNGNVLAAVGPPPSAYTRVDLSVVWHPLPNLDVSLGVQNAFEPHHLESSYNAKASTSVDRAVYAKFTWKF